MNVGVVPATEDWSSVHLQTGAMMAQEKAMARNFDIAQREYDKRFVTWVETDDPNVDRDFYYKNGIPCPQVWIPIAVTHTKEAAIRATKSYRPL
jgi:hypothetical protein